MTPKTEYAMIADKNMKRIKRMMSFYVAVGVAVVAACLYLLDRITQAHEPDSDHSGDIILYVGTYGDSIYRYIFDPCEETFSFLGSAEAVNASYLALSSSADGTGVPVIYAVSENGGESGVSSFADNIEMSLLSYCGGTGADPCYILVCESETFPDGQYVMTADYSGGSVSVFSTSGGRIDSLVQQIRFSGGGPVAGRQESSHIHQLKFVPDTIREHLGIKGEWLLASDLGADKIRLLELCRTSSCAESRSDGTSFPQPLSVVEALDICCGAGSGPRHMEFNESRNQLYCVTELSGELIVYDISSDDGKPVFKERQRILADETRAGGSADIHLHPSGRFLYTSHRLSNDGIAVFSVADSVSRTGYVRTSLHPRNFTITPDGSKMLVACRDDKVVTVYDIDGETGMLRLNSARLDFDSDMPVCLVY